MGLCCRCISVNPFDKLRERFILHFAAVDFVDYSQHVHVNTIRLRDITILLGMLEKSMKQKRYSRENRW